MILGTFYEHQALLGDSFRAEVPASITKADTPVRQSVVNDGVTN